MAAKCFLQQASVEPNASGLKSAAGVDRMREFFNKSMIDFNKQVTASNLFFHYLSSKKQIGFNPAQYHIYRDNMALRTSYTISYVARVIVAAAREFDYDTVAGYGKNLYEEAGEGDKYSVHFSLFADCFNLHGEKIFNLPAMNMKEIHKSSLILPETWSYIESQELIYESQDYLHILGVSFAQETVADGMLNEFYKSIFMPYKGYYDKKEFEKIRKYFDAHILNGVELEHGVIAKEAVIRACNSQADIDEVFKSATGFLDAQTGIWRGLLREMRKHEANPIKPKK